MANLEVHQFEVAVLDIDRLRRGIGAQAMTGSLELFDRRANVELDEDWEEPLVQIGGYALAGRVSLAVMGSGATFAVVQTWDMPRPAKYRDMPDAEELAPTMADDITGVRAYILAYAYDGAAKNRVVAEIWDRNLTDFEHDAVDALPMLLHP